MKTSEAIQEISKALAAAQSELPSPKRDTRVSTGSYSYTYADLDSVIRSVRPVLAKHGLSILQEAAANNGGVAVVTRLIHSSGEWIEADPLTFMVQGGPQAAGSAITYARRYSLTALLGLATEDDDGSQAEDTNRQLASDQKNYKARMARKPRKGLAGQGESEETAHQGVVVSDTDGASSPAESSEGGAEPPGYGEGLRSEAPPSDDKSREGEIGLSEEEAPRSETDTAESESPSLDDLDDFTFTRGKYLGFKCKAVFKKDPAWLRENLSGIKNPKNRAIAERLLGNTAAPESTPS
jgi:ERF superfamily protein